MTNKFFEIFLGCICPLPLYIYVKNLIAQQNVDPKNLSAPKWQFNGLLANGNSAGFMLNTDFELFYNLTLNPTTAQTTCLLNPVCGLPTPNTCKTNCQVAPTFKQALSYSKVYLINSFNTSLLISVHFCLIFQAFNTCLKH